MGVHFHRLQYFAVITDALRNIFYMISIFFFAHINKVNNNFLVVVLLCVKAVCFQFCYIWKFALQESFNQFILHDGVGE